ncbi:MAG TPA: chemotaxis protein CheW [bacterium]|nr:chemotaxis protein CheW [bacterium]
MALSKSVNQEQSGQEMGMSDFAGMYLTFQLGGETYGLEILKVQEIIGMMNVTRVPRTPSFVRGVINLRGKVIPVVDLRMKFELASQEDTNRTCIIVVQVARGNQSVTMGILVDEVSEVLDINGNQIEPAPKFGDNISTDFILGMGKVAQKVVMLLDVEKVLSGGEIAVVDQIGKDN